MRYKFKLKSYVSISTFQRLSQKKSDSRQARAILLPLALMLLFGVAGTGELFAVSANYLEKPAQTHPVFAPVLSQTRRTRPQSSAAQRLKFAATAGSARIPSASQIFVVAQDRQSAIRREVAAIQKVPFPSVSSERHQNHGVMVRTGVFSPARVANPTMKKDIRKVQIGRFKTEASLQSNASIKHRR